MPYLIETTRTNNIIAQIANTLIYYPVQGLNVDYEEINEKSGHTLTKFLQQLYSELHCMNL